jgi:methylenetetrahydrofolate--tRNA-(uracil-5-)-methyltransferase
MNNHLGQLNSKHINGAYLNKITIVGGGLAGSEASLYLADKGWKVTLYEMRPKVLTPAHKTGYLAEVVCSNSFKSKLIETSSGLLKQEMKLLGSKLLVIAENHAVAAGNALAIDRDKFAEEVTHRIANHPNITVIREEVKEIPNSPLIIATGPLTSDAMVQSLQVMLGEKQLYFFDAIAPIVSADSLNHEILFSKTRYDKGEADYLNCPLNKDEYYTFVHALKESEKHEAKEFENQFFQNMEFKFYENCMPIEEIARRGEDSLRFGVMRPVGLEDHRTGKRAYAILQLRAENIKKTAYNLVGCQTMMKYGEQKRILRLLPGFEDVDILRYGSIHRNTYLNGPEIMDDRFSLKKHPGIYIAGQLSGVEGYVESILSGLLVAKVVDEDMPMLPETTMSGQLWRHLVEKKTQPFQPMNANFGLLPEIEMQKKNKTLKKQLLSERAIQSLKQFLS